MAEKDDPRSRSDSVIKQFQHLSRVLHGLGQRDFLHYHSVTFGSEVPGLLAAGMFLIGHQDLFAWFHVNSVGDIAVGLGGVSQQRHFVAFAAYKCSQRITEFVPRSVAPDGIIFRILLIHFLGLVVAVKDRAQDRSGTASHGAVVQVDFVGGNKKLLAQFRPISFFIFLVKIGFRKRGRSFLELGEHVIAKGQAGSESGGRGKKTSTIEQMAPPDSRKASCYDYEAKVARPCS